MKIHTITITPEGNVEFLGDTLPIDLPLGKTVRRRVSVIRPLNVWKRIAFISLRLLCKDTGRAAAFTRTWRGPWRATILATGQSAVFENRQAAIDWEYEVLTGPKFEL